MSGDLLTTSFLRGLEKDLKPEIFDILKAIEEKFIEPLLREASELIIEKYWGGNPIIGIFGSYRNGGKELIHDLAKKIVYKGCVAVIGDGFYHPNAPLELQSLDTIYTPTVKNLVSDPENEFFLYEQFLPYLIDKALIRVYPYRTNDYELAGCRRNRKPVLGFIIHDEVQPREDDCHWVEVDSSSHGISKECKCVEIQKCPIIAPKKPHCIIYDLYPITQIHKNWFNSIVNWHFIAINQIEKIDDYLDSFLY